MSDFSDFFAIFRRRANAVAVIKGSEKYPSIEGRVQFYRVLGGVMVFSDIRGLPKAGGDCRNIIFAFHIHEGGECSGNQTDPFADAGGHFNPNGCPHPFHAGDMPPLFGADGKAVSAFLTDRFSVSDIIGKAVMIHAMTDDFTSQPAGDAGEKIACGIIK